MEAGSSRIQPMLSSIFPPEIPSATKTTPQVNIDDSPGEDDLLSSGSSNFGLGKLRRQLTALYNRNIGLLIIAGSQLFFAIMNLAVKLLTNLDDPVPALELIWIRMFITYVFCIGYMHYDKVDHKFLGPPDVRWLLVFRGVSGFFGLFGMYFSLQYLSLSDATVLSFLSPSVVGITGYLFLKEPFSRREAMAGLCSLFGVVLIARPKSLFGSSDEDAENGVTSAQRLIAVGVALVGVLGATGAYTSLRAIGRKAHTLHSLAFFSQYCVLVSTTLMIIQRETIVIPKQWIFLMLLFMIGFFGFIAQAMLVMGLQRETASRGTMGVYVQILFAGALEQIFLKIRPSTLSVVGAIIILASAIYIAVTRQHQIEDPKTSKQVHWNEDVESRGGSELSYAYSQLSMEETESGSKNEIELHAVGDSRLKDGQPDSA